MARFAVFRVVLQAPASGPTSVDYHTVAGTATEGEDYTPAAGTLEFAQGETQKDVRVALRSTEEIDEESFTLVLTNPQGLVLGRFEASATIPAGEVPGDLDGLFPNRVLAVLFYQGEKHPGGGGDLSDSEWVMAPGDATYVDTGDPYPGVFGQMLYNLGPFTLTAGGGNIPMLSGWYLNTLCQDNGSGGAVMQVSIGNRIESQPDGSLDPATADAFNTWWDAHTFPLEFALVDADGNDVFTFATTGNSTTDPTTPSDPTLVRGGATYTAPVNKDTLTGLTLKLRTVA